MTTFSVDLRPSYNMFLSILAAAQQNGETLEHMQRMVETMQHRLDTQWTTLSDLAYQGLEPAVCAMLDVFLREWSGMQALTLIVDREAWVDPSDLGVQHAFWAKLTRHHTWLDNRLPIPFNKGVQERNAQAGQAGLKLVETRVQVAEQEIDRQFQQHHTWLDNRHLISFNKGVQECNTQACQAGLKLVEARVQAAEQEIDRQFQQNQELIQTVNSLLGQLQQQNTTPEVVRDAHEDSRESLQVAIEAVSELQQAALEATRQSQQTALDAVRETRHVVNDMVQSARDIIQSTHQYVQQSLPALMEQDMGCVDRQRLMRRVWFFVGIGLAILLPFGFVFIFVK